MFKPAFMRALEGFEPRHLHTLSVFPEGDDPGAGGGDDDDDGGDDDAGGDDDDDEGDGDDDDDDDDAGDDDAGGDDNDTGDDDDKKAKEGKEETPQKAAARRKRELMKDPHVQRLLKQNTDKAVRQALAEQAKKDEKAKKRAGMEDGERLQEELQEERAKREDAELKASEAVITREFFQAMTESDHKPRTKKALGMILQLASEKVADDGVDFDVAIEELADEESYLFTDTSDDAAGDDDDDPADGDPEDAVTRAARSRNKAKKRAKNRSSTARTNRATGKPAGTPVKTPKDALKMTPEEWRAHKKHLGVH